MEPLSASLDALYGDFTTAAASENLTVVPEELAQGPEQAAAAVGDRVGPEQDPGAVGGGGKLVAYLRKVTATSYLAGLHVAGIFRWSAR